MSGFAISSDFAVLDVKKGRHALEKHFDGAPRLGRCPDALRVPVMLTGYLDGVLSGDDGCSIEFSVELTSLQTGAAGNIAPMLGYDSPRHAIDFAVNEVGHQEVQSFLKLFGDGDWSTLQRDWPEYADFVRSKLPSEPNAETIAAMNEARNGEATGPFKTVEDLMESLDE